MKEPIIMLQRGVLEADEFVAADAGPCDMYVRASYYHHDIKWHDSASHPEG